MKSFGSNFLPRSEFLSMLYRPVTKIIITALFAFGLINSNNILKMHHFSCIKMTHFIAFKIRGEISEY